MKILKLYFYGYTWEEYAFQISSLKGIFIVYSGNLDPEGSVKIKEVLYVGFHNGIKELYDTKILDDLKNCLKKGDRLYLSLAEVTSEEEGNILAMKIEQTITPFYRHNSDPTTNLGNYEKIMCTGQCDLIPEVII